MCILTSIPTTWEIEIAQHLFRNNRCYLLWSPRALVMNILHLKLRKCHYVHPLKLIQMAVYLIFRWSYGNPNRIQYQLSILFYNFNIHPIKEYLISRKKIFAVQRITISILLTANYDTQNWFERAKVWKNELGKGIRYGETFLWG